MGLLSAFRSKSSRSVKKIGSKNGKEHLYQVKGAESVATRDPSRPREMPKSPGPPGGKPCFSFSSIASGAVAPQAESIPTPPENFQKVAQYLCARTTRERVIRAQYKAGIFVFIYCVFYLVTLMIQSDVHLAYQMTSTTKVRRLRGVCSAVDPLAACNKRHVRHRIDLIHRVNEQYI